MAVMVIGATAYAQDPVKVESVNGATTVGVDVLSKPSATLQFIRGNWGKLLIGAGTAIAVDRVAYNNDWLWYEGNKPKNTTNTSGGNLAVDTASTSTGSAITITGNGNTVNQTVIVQTPANGPATQASPSTGGGR